MNAQTTNKNEESMADEYGKAIARDTVRLERLLPGPIERVWRYLTESDARGKWLATGNMELKVGGTVEHIFNNNALTGHDDPPPPKYEKHACSSTMTGRVTHCDPPNLLAYTWGEESGEDSHVRFELDRRGDKVRLVVTHSRLVSRDMMLSVAAGWHAHIGILIDRLNGRAPESFWPMHTRLEAAYEKIIPSTPAQN
ncbi:MAG: SRPBCC family protein [Gammaproteobacteria bacterium]|nr:SRPBCC family protein [Gammaproteobacteria bacterium]MDH5215376.1 SRPBCC family protein [Gammaproteobacteria bacterium]